MREDLLSMIRKRIRRIIIITIVLFLPVCFLMLSIGSSIARHKGEKTQELRIDTMHRLVGEINDYRAEAVQLYDEELEKSIRIMTVSLRELITEEGYTGDYIFSDGFVAELDGDRVIIPDEIQLGDLQLTRGMIETSIASGEMRTGHYLISNTKGGSGEEESFQDYLDRSMYLSFGRITDDLIYVDMTSEREYIEYESLYLYDNYDALKTASELFESITMLVRIQGSQVEMIRRYSGSIVSDDPADYGISKDTILEKTPRIVLDGIPYDCAYFEQPNIGTQSEKFYMVQMMPLKTDTSSNLFTSILTSSIILLIELAVIVYVFSLQKYIAENDLTAEQADLYRPSRTRRIITASGISGIIAVFVAVFVTSSLGVMNKELDNGERILESLMNNYHHEISVHNDALIEDEGSWDIYNGEKIVSLLTKYPSLKSEKVLREYCGILNADYIMLFDSNGNETLSSNEYIGFTLDKGLGDNASDFRRLLYGIPAIIHEPSHDELTNKTRKYVGIRMPEEDESAKYGAMVVAEFPESKETSRKITDLSEELFMLKAEGRYCFIADELTGVIKYAGDESMIGRKVEEIGLSGLSLQDGYIDFGNIDDVRHFIITQRDSDMIFYYTMADGLFFEYILSYALVSALLFAVFHKLLMEALTQGHSDAEYDKLMHRMMSPEGKQFRENIQTSESRMAKYIKTLLKWDSRTPSNKAWTAFNFGLYFMMVMLHFLLVKILPDYNPLVFARFILNGKWVGGFNLFSVCGTILIIGIIYIFCFVAGRVLDLLSNVFSGAGKTFCKLLKSFLQYSALFYGMYMIFGYFGFPVGTIVASLGLVSLALSLGAKDLASDIIAGLFILFERTFKVGDIVEINGKRGTILEVGIRSTQMRDSTYNIETISNHNIDTVVNLSETDSFCQIRLKVPADMITLSETEELLYSKLPEISRKTDLILGEVVYKGVSSAGGEAEDEKGTPTFTVTVGAYCKEKYVSPVRYFLNREMYLLFESRGIQLR